MPNATISTLISEIATVALDTTAVNTYQDETFLEIARLAKGTNILLNTTAAFIQTISEQVVYSLPANIRQALVITFDDNVLSLARYDEAHFFDPTWRSTPVDNPVAVMLDTFNRTTFAVVPPATKTGDDPTGQTPFAFAPFPGHDLMVIGTLADTTFAGTNVVDVYPAVAFEVLAKELGRDSDHMDPDMANAAKTMADLFWRLSFPEGVNG